jgi:hypothetical protein
MPHFIDAITLLIIDAIISIIAIIAIISPLFRHY